jgi:phosphoenolpyruvate carboxylase
VGDVGDVGDMGDMGEMGDGGAGFSEWIVRDFRDAEAGILAVTGQARLLDDSAVIQKSIMLRNPYTDVLNLVQVELLRRARPAGAGEVGDGDVRLREALFLSVNAIAAAMQSTG